MRIEGNGGERKELGKCGRHQNYIDERSETNRRAPRRTRAIPPKLAATLREVGKKKRKAGGSALCRVRRSYPLTDKVWFKEET